MELIYSAQTTGFEAGKRYRNPRYFEKPEPGVAKVVVMGDWPAVVDAYKAAGVEVTTGKPSKAKTGKAAAPSGSEDKPIDELTIAELHEKLKAKGIEYPSAANKAELQELLKGNQA